MATCAPQPMRAKAVFRELVRSGQRVNQSAVYRALQRLEAAGLLGEWGRAARLNLCCPDSGRTAVLVNPRLHAQLLAATEAAGWNLAGHGLVIEVDHFVPAGTSTFRPLKCLR